MGRLSSVWLSGALVCALVPFAAQAQGLPDGPGKDMVEGVCAGCHQVGLIERSSGYTEEGWKELIDTMIDLSASPEELDEIAGYLAAHFPPNDRRAPTEVSGDVQIAFTEWTVPTLGQRSRDPAEAPDGAIWWAGQWGNLIGRLDPMSGEMEEHPLPAGAMPHTVLLDGDGHAWYTGNRNATIGKLDPATGEVTEFPMPDPAARDPHSAIFDREGILWFTLQGSNMVGRLDPETGEIRLAAMPIAGARPYGIKIDAEGAPWFACNGSNCLVRIDPETMDLDIVELSTPGTTVRRLDFAEDGTIWCVNSSQGAIGRLDPQSGEFREWPSPSGPASHPYAIAVIDGIVWYNESGMRPDMLVRFDPEAEAFQSWPIPSGGVHAGIVRHMRPTRDGNLLIHQSSTNRIILVTIEGEGAAR